jgi:hypothetical protein
MLFKLVEHYDYEEINDNNILENNNINKNNNKDKDNFECFICYEMTCENELEPIKLNSKIYYLKNCNCDGFIHKKCLTIWYNKNKKCPICRMYMEEKENISVVIFNKYRYILFVLLVLRNNLHKLLRFVSFIFLLYFIFDYYLLVIVIKSKLENDFYDINYYTNKTFI